MSRLKFKALESFEDDEIGNFKVIEGDVLECSYKSGLFVKTKSKNGENGFIPLNKLGGTSSNALYCFVHHQYTPFRDDELELTVGTIIEIEKFESDGWCFGSIANTNNHGWFPVNFVTVLTKDFQDSTREKSLKHQSCNLITPAPPRMNFKKPIYPIIANSLRSKSMDIIPEFCLQYSCYKWFHGKMSGVLCERTLLKYGSIGDFLVRIRPDEKSLTITVLGVEKIHNYLITYYNGLFRHGKQEREDLAEIVNLYQEYPIGMTDECVPILLKTPFNKIYYNSTFV